MSAANFQIDPTTVRNFTTALQLYANERANNRSFEYCINRAAKDVCYRAAQYTHRANKEALREILSNKQRAARVLRSRIVRKGKQPPKGAAWTEMLSYFMKHTLKTVNFMRAGWLPAAKKFEAVVRESPGVSRAIAFGRADPNIPTKNAYPEIGEGILASQRIEGIVAEIANRSVNPRNPTSWTAGLGKHGPIGLQRALAFKARDLLHFVDLAHDKRAARFNA